MADYIRVQLPKAPTGVVVRPRPDGEQETLVFLTDAVHVLEGDSWAGKIPLKLGRPLDLTAAVDGNPHIFGRLLSAHPTYDPATNCVYFYENDGLIFYCPRLKRLDAGNAVSGVRASEGEATGGDGGLTLVQFNDPGALVADGSGSAFAKMGQVFRKVDFGSGRVQETRWSKKLEELAIDLVYHTPTRTLHIATRTALYRVHSDRDDEELFAGQEGTSASLDGCGVDARFKRISRLILTPDGHSVCVLDGTEVRKVNLWTHDVTTIAKLDIGYIANSDCLGMAVLPRGGGLALLFRDQPALYVARSPDPASCDSSIRDATANETVAARALAAQLPALLRQPESGPACISVRVGGPGGATFTVHRSVLMRRSAYFQGCLAGGFRESDAPEVDLPEMDPDVFGFLLSYMYSGSFADLPEERLRPTAEAAGMLLLDTAPERLQSRLLAATSPETVLADLVWADKLELGELVQRLQDKAVLHYQAVLRATPPEKLSEVLAAIPDVMAGVAKAAAASGPDLP